VKALVTGGEGGIGLALRALLAREGYDVESLDLRTGFDVTDPDAWEQVEAVDAAFLNAGVLAGDAGPGSLDLGSYRRALAVNVDGVVLGVRRLAQVMDGGTIVATASLAGLTGMPSDFVYSLTKHAVVGFVRSAAPRLGAIRLNAVCPGIADTPMIDVHRTAFEAAAFPLLDPAAVA
jgi:NAD(P)-dependent dehydrogenase (short-subunit alcohol dehydrogenase family)